jgi:hypothetical protein
MFRLSSNLLKRLTPDSTVNLIRELGGFQRNKIGDSYLQKDSFYNPGNLNLLIPFCSDSLTKESSEDINSLLLTLLSFYVSHDIVYNKDLTENLFVFLQNFSNIENDSLLNQIFVEVHGNDQIKIGEGRAYKLFLIFNF